MTLLISSTMDRGCRPHHRLRAAHALRLTGKKNGRARVFSLRERASFSISLSLSSACALRGKGDKVVPCALSNFLFRKNHRAKRYQFIWIHATDASKCSFSIDFFLLGQKIETFFLFQTTEERKARKGEKTRNFLFFCPPCTRKRTTTTTTTTTTTRAFTSCASGVWSSLRGGENYERDFIKDITCERFELFVAGVSRAPSQPTVLSRQC